MKRIYLQLNKTSIRIGKAGKIENTGDTKGHEGPRYRQETIDANRPDQNEVVRVRGWVRMDGGGQEREEGGTEGKQEESGSVSGRWWEGGELS